MGKREAFNIQLKTIEYDIGLIKNNGCNLKDIGKMKFRLLKQSVGENNIRCLLMLDELLMNTSFFSIESKLYFGNYTLQYGGVSDELKFNHNIESNVQNVSSKIHYDKKKFIGSFGDKIILDLAVEGKNNYKKYGGKIAEVLKSYKEKNVFKNLDLNLQSKGEINFDCTDDEFNEFMDIIVPYTKMYREAVSANLDKGMVGYITYLLSSEHLTDKDLDRVNDIKRLMGV